MTYLCTSLIALQQGVLQKGSYSRLAGIDAQAA